MKKLNNKGFAISTLLYGLMIMSFLIILALISILGTNRKNTKTLVEKIEDELNRYSLTDTSGDYEGGEIDSNGREYIAPSNGWYKIELWGASGFGTGSSSAGRGAYTSGTIYLEANAHLYFYVGEAGKAPCTPYNTCNNSTFNGGGQGGFFTSNKQRYGSGGGATDVRLVAGNWNDAASLYSRIMVAGGGGSTDGINTGSSGGTLLGDSGSTKEHGAIAGKGGTQSTGGASGKYAGKLGLGGDGFIPNSTNACCNDAFGGGGGYYGGGGGYSGDPSYCSSPCTIRGYGGGGSSFIMGYAGVRTVTDSGGATTDTKRSYNIEYGEYDASGNPIKTNVTPVIYNGLMVPGVHSGNGKFSVTKVSENAKDNPPRKGSNSKLNNVRYIKDCVDSSTSATSGEWIEIQALVDGVNIAKGRGASGSGLSNASIITDGVVDNTSSVAAMTATGQKCVTIDLGTTKNLDEIAVWHQYSNNRSYRGHMLQVSANNSSWQIVRAKSSETDATGQENEKETANGVHYHSIQSDPTVAVTDGNYYIFPASSDNQVFTYDPGDNDNARLSLFTGEKSQIWKIQKVPNGYYHIIETATGKALAVTDGTGDADVNIDVDLDNLNNPAQDWSFTSLGNGYYKLVSRLGSYAGINGLSNVITQGKSSAKTQRFKLVNAEY